MQWNEAPVSSSFRHLTAAATAIVVMVFVVASVPNATAQQLSTDPAIQQHGPFGQPAPPLSSAGQQRAALTPNIAPQSTAALPAANATDYRLGSGDHVRVTVFGQEDLTGEYQVDGSGRMSFPLLGQVQAGGLTADELRQKIASGLSPDYLKNPKISVEVLTYRPFYIVGEVRTPGSYAYVSGMSVINAIALAGGFTYRAKENSFYLTRADEKGGKVRLDANQETPVQPGDVITVRERFF